MATPVGSTSGICKNANIRNCKESDIAAAAGVRRSSPRKQAHLLTGPVLEQVAARFRVLGDPSRLRILSQLMQGEHAVQELVEATGLTQTTVSRHLGLLRRERLVTRKAVANRALYRICDATVFALCELVCGGLAEQAAESAQAFSRGGGS